MCMSHTGPTEGISTCFASQSDLITCPGCLKVARVSQPLGRMVFPAASPYSCLLPVAVSTASSWEPCDTQLACKARRAPPLSPCSPPFLFVRSSPQFISLPPSSQKPTFLPKSPALQLPQSLWSCTVHLYLSLCHPPRQVLSCPLGYVVYMLY